MREYNITRQDGGMKLLRFLNKMLPNAGTGFLYKMLRKKNIKLNDKKADGNEELKAGDNIKIFFSEETFNIFSKEDREIINTCTEEMPALDIIYEDEDIMLINKPAGILSQKAEKKDISMVEIIDNYLKKNSPDNASVNAFKPAVANRLDRNTSGIIAAGKSTSGLQYLSGGFKNREFNKYYMCIVKGVIQTPRLFNGLWSKNAHGNKVEIKNVGWKKEDGRHFPKEYFVKGNIPVQTAVYPVINNGKSTLLKVDLLTGKSHQIRAQLAEAGFPLLGDYKYGKREYNDYYRDKYKTEFQLLHAFMLEMPEKGIFYADIPDYFENVLKGENLWEHGIREVFADQSLRI